MSRPSVSAKGSPVTFHLPTGEKVSLICQQSDTFRDIKDKIWAKKNLDLDRKQCYITIKDMELLFQDDEHFSRMVNLYDIYRESAAEGSILKAAVVPAADINDKAKRAAKKPTENGNYVAQGILYKRGSSKSSMFKKRYFVLEGFTLFYFESESAFVSNEPATDFIPMGGCSVVRTEELYKNKRVCFELHAEHLDRRNFSLAAESEEDLQKWFNAFYVVNFRRVKTLTIHCVETLLRKNALEEEGIFRLSGSQSAIQQLKAQYDAGDFPNLMEVKDCHSITGLMKLAIRELAEPVLTFARYPFFVDAGNADEPVRVERIKELIDTLPQSNKGFLAYLMHFVNKASTFADKSKMAAKNLSIVFAPNLLRPQVDTVNTMNDTQNVLAVIQTMIEHAADIWPETHVSEPEDEHDPDSDDESTTRASTSTSTASAPGRKTPPISPRGARPPPLPAPGASPGISDHVRSLSQNPALAALNPAHLRGPSGHALPGLGLPKSPPPLPATSAAPAEPDDDSVQMSANPLLSPRSAEAKGLHAKGLSGGMMMGGRNMLDELKNKQNRLKSISGDSNAAAPPLGGPPAGPPPAAFRPPPPSFPAPFTPAVALPSAQPPRTTTPTPSAPATATVSGFELMIARKQQEDLLALWEKNYNERKAALNKAWSAVSAALAAGGEINAEIFEHLKSQLNDTEQLQQKATSDFDKNVALLNSLAASIAASKQAAEASTLEAPVSRPRLESMPPPPPPRHEPRKPSIPPPLPAGIQSTHAQKKIATAQFDYTGGHRVDELTFKEGTHVEILIEDTPDQPGWWQGRVEDKVGWFPASYVTYSS